LPEWPVGAFGGKTSDMGVFSPLGPVYQAGTLLVILFAMVAGLAVLNKIK